MGLVLAAAAAWALAKGRELGSSRRKMWCCLGCRPGTESRGRAASLSPWVFIQFLTGVTESRATRMGTLFNGWEKKDENDMVLISNNWFLALSTVLWRRLYFFYQSICCLTGTSWIWSSPGPYWLQTTDKPLNPLGLSCVINTQAQDPILQSRVLEPVVAWDSFPF